jgi:putative addiction module killer protein
MENEIEKTEIFDKWLRKLKDHQAAVAIIKRLGRAKLGNFGDAEPVGEGVSEMRIFTDPDYRLYYTIRQSTIIFMLCGGDKSSQKKDIKNELIFWTFFSLVSLRPQLSSISRTAGMHKEKLACAELFLCGSPFRLLYWFQAYPDLSVWLDLTQPWQLVMA